jgi:hypothetical protein
MNAATKKSESTENEMNAKLEQEIEMNSFSTETTDASQGTERMSNS